MKIGILEDNQSLSLILQFSLEKAGYIVYGTQTSRDFLHFMTSSEKADLIVVDFRLLAEHSEGGSNLSGTDVIRRIRTTSPDLPAILISAAPLDTLEAAVYGLAGVKILQKPFKMLGLLEVIQTLV